MSRIIWKQQTITYLSFHLGPALLLLFAFSHVLVLLLGLSERLHELIEDAKELIWLHLTGIFAEVLYCPQELWDQREVGYTKEGGGDVGLDLQQDTAEPCFTLSLTVLQETH